MNKILTQFLAKSFSKLAPNATVSNGMVANVIETAAMTQDFLENTSKKLGNKPNADIIFKRIKQCDIDKLVLASMFILELMLLNVKRKLNCRSWILAIDTHYEPFYGNYTDLWVHGYRPEGFKDCTGSYCYITIAIVAGNARFTLLALPVHVGQNNADMVEQLLLFARKHIRVSLVLLDRGFDSGSVTRKLNNSKIGYITFARRNEKIKKFFEQTPEFGHRYFHDCIEWREDKSTQREKAKYLLIRDYIDLRTFKVYDWCFITNLANLKAESYVHMYMIRWCIENSYKQLKQLKIKTVSTDHAVRYFLFLFQVLLYNLWRFYNLVMNVGLTLKEFVFKMFLASVDVDHIKCSRNDLEMFLDRISIRPQE